MTQKRWMTRRLICWRYCLNAILAAVLTSFCSFSAFAQESLDISESQDEEVASAEKQDPNLSKTPIVKPLNSKRDDTTFDGSSYYRVLVSGVGSLALVIGAFLGGVYVLKLLAPGKFSRNSELVQIVDSCCLNRKSELLTIKWGAKLILLSSSLDRTVVLSEISDSQETERILRVLQEQKINRHVKELKVIKLHNLFRKKTDE